MSVAVERAKQVTMSELNAIIGVSKALFLKFSFNKRILNEDFVVDVSIGRWISILSHVLENVSHCVTFGGKIQAKYNKICN